jgi:hypothetical protein
MYAEQNQGFTAIGPDPGLPASVQLYATELGCGTTHVCDEQVSCTPHMKSVNSMDTCAEMDAYNYSDVKDQGRLLVGTIAYMA